MSAKPDVQVVVASVTDESEGEGGVAAAEQHQPNKVPLVQRLFAGDHLPKKGVMDFLNWCKQREVLLHPDVHVLAPISGMGLGAVAKRHINAGAVLISTPHSAYISPVDTEIAHCPAAAIIDAHRPRISDWTRTVLRLLAEVGRAKESPWLPWLRTMPYLSGFLLIPGKPLVEALQWSAVGQAIADLDAEGNWKSVEGFVKSHPEVWPEKCATLEIFAQCAAQVASRNFHVEARQREGPFLVPGVDVLNHSANKANVSFALRGKHISFQVEASKDIAAGEQLFHNYGPLSNARFLVEFGFVDQGNVNNALRLSQPLLILLAAEATDGDVGLRDAAERVKLLDRIGVVYFEGLYLGQQVNKPTSKPQEEDERKLSELGVVTPQGLEIPPSFFTVSYLLTLPVKEWEATRGRVARWWAPEGAAAQKAARCAGKKFLLVLQGHFDDSLQRVPELLEVAFKEKFDEKSIKEEEAASLRRLGAAVLMDESKRLASLVAAL